MAITDQEFERVRELALRLKNAVDNLTAAIGNGGGGGGGGNGQFTGSFSGSAELSGQFTGSFSGSHSGSAELTGSFSGSHYGNHYGNFSGTAQITGGLEGNVNGNLYGTVYGDVNGGCITSECATLTGSFKGNANLTGSFSGSAELSGQFTGSFSGSHSGSANLTGSFSGIHSGSAELTGSFSGSFFGRFYGPAGGDLSGSYPDPVVDGIQTIPVSAQAPLNRQYLIYNGTNWKPDYIIYNTTNSNGTYVVSASSPTLTASYTASTDNLILCSGAVDIRLPAALANDGRMYFIKNIGINVIRIMSINNTTFIDGQLTASIKTTYSSYNIISANSNWWII